MTKSASTSSVSATSSVRNDSRNLFQLVWASLRGLAYYGEEAICEAGATATTLLRSTREVTDLGSEELRKYIKTS